MSPPDKEYRKVDGRNPLFLIMFAAISKRKKDAPKNDPAEKTVASFGISFPGDSGGTRRAKKLVQYSVNTTWWKQNMEITEEEDYEDL
jgi:hypothetical protein